MTTVDLVGGIERCTLAPVDHDPRWPPAYREQVQCIRAALGPAAVQVEHVGCVR